MSSSSSFSSSSSSSAAPWSGSFKLGLFNKKVLVTGSTSGIGYGIALSFAREGCEVYVNGRSEINVFTAIEKMKSDPTSHPHSKYYPAIGDLSTEEGSEKVIKAVSSELDILVCNVGIFEVKDYGNISDADWLNYFQVNVMSTVRVTRHYFPLMLKRNQHNRIIIISSEAGLKPHPYMNHYSMTKSAQINIACGLAQLTKGTTVTVNTVLPGPTDTEGLKEYMKGVAEKQQVSYDEAVINYFATVESNSLIQRPIQVQEVANAVLFLSSPAAAAVNGAAQRVEGGILRNI